MLAKADKIKASSIVSNFESVFSWLNLENYGQFIRQNVRGLLNFLNQVVVNWYKCPQNSYWPNPPAYREHRVSFNSKQIAQFWNIWYKEPRNPESKSHWLDWYPTYEESVRSIQVEISYFEGSEKYLWLTILNETKTHQNSCIMLHDRKSPFRSYVGRPEVMSQ